MSPNPLIALPMLLGRGARTREQVIAQSARTWATIGSPGYPTPGDEIRRRAGETYDRGMDAAGVVRQMQAVVAQPDRTRRLRDLRIPATPSGDRSARTRRRSAGSPPR